jgi:hypothetical protein
LKEANGKLCEKRRRTATGRKLECERDKRDRFRQDRTYAHNFRQRSPDKTGSDLHVSLSEQLDDAIVVGVVRIVMDGAMKES